MARDERHGSATMKRLKNESNWHVKVLSDPIGIMKFMIG